MSLKADFLTPCLRIGLTASFSALALVVLAACGTRPAPPGAPKEAASPSPLPATPPAAAAADSTAQTRASPSPSPSANANANITANAGPADAGAGAGINPAPPLASNDTSSPATPPASAAAFPLAPAEMVVRQLAYADRVRALSSAELNQEIARLGNPSAPAGQLQLALLLSQLHQTQELVRAQELLSRVINSAAPEAQPLQPLARLLAARYGEQRRLEEQLEKQLQQTRDVQRRLDQTHERLEALKAIERSLTSRLPSPGASAPAIRRNRPAAP